VRKTPTKKQHISDGHALPGLHLSFMGYYEERPPRHGHRSPTELADDELLSAIHGDFCGMPEAIDATVLAANAERGCLTHFALLARSDAHPFISTSVKPRVNADGPNSNRTPCADEKVRGEIASHDNADS
jgi:hypothetical protein